MQVVSSALPIAAPIRRQAMPWAIQNSRIAGIGVRQREVVGGEGMREIRRVEVEADLQPPRPVDPFGEVLRVDGVAVDALAAEVAVEGVQVEAMASGDQREGLFGVGAELLGRARLARIVAGRGQPAAELHPELLEPADVIPLPAVQRDGDLRQPGECRIGIDAVLGVPFPGVVVGPVQRIMCHQQHRRMSEAAESISRSGFAVRGGARFAVRTSRESVASCCEQQPAARPDARAWGRRPHASSRGWGPANN